MERRTALGRLLLVLCTSIAACEPPAKTRGHGDDDDGEPSRKRSADANPDGSQAPAAAPFKFERDLDAGIARARKEARPTLLFFSAEWNMACKDQQKVFADPKLAAALSRYVGVLVDMTDQEDPKTMKAQRDHKTLGVPAMLLLDSSGREVRRVEQFQPVEKWLEWLPAVE